MAHFLKNYQVVILSALLAMLSQVVLTLPLILSIGHEGV